jgi:hypothetical protein
VYLPVCLPACLPGHLCPADAQALVAAELRSSARMAAICEWGAGQRLPVQAAPSAAASAHAAAGSGHEDAAWEATARSYLYDGYDEDAATVGWRAQGAVAGLEYSNMPSSGDARMPAGVTDWDVRSSVVWAGHAGDQTAVRQEQWRCSAASLSSGVGSPCLPLASGGRQQAVEDLLQANAHLLQKLAK